MTVDSGAESDRQSRREIIAGFIGGGVVKS